MGVKGLRLKVKSANLISSKWTSCVWSDYIKQTNKQKFTHRIHGETSSIPVNRNSHHSQLLIDTIALSVEKMNLHILEITVNFYICNFNLYNLWLYNDILLWNLENKEHQQYLWNVNGSHRKSQSYVEK